MDVRSWKGRRGFTLIELLLVIAVIAIIATILIVVLNPAETLKKSRDAQRFSDMAALKSALGFYLLNTTTPQLAGTGNGDCKSGNAGAGSGTYTAGDKIYYSTPTSSNITDATLDGGTGSVPAPFQAATPSLVDGNGWLPVDFESLTGGTPLSNLPLDPVNRIASVSAVASTDLVYRYACNATTLTFEINTQLESLAFTAGDNDRRTADGGNNNNYYEVGTNLKILGAGSDF
jgi:prepilin-type N-terminal cleavage/methylation domain-containing protein